MELNLLKIDLDSETLDSAIDTIWRRLAYMNDIGFFPFKHIKKIIAGKKSSWNVKIYLKKDLNPEMVMLFQNFLGSDWRKEINTALNHYCLKMKYANRMFDIKSYKDGEIKVSKKVDITKDVHKYITDPKRGLYYI